jgi:protein-S-isoprenylcysteine O-methyltransferase Ste14
MHYFLRHLLSVLILPVTVVGIVPAWIYRRFDVHIARPGTAGDWMCVSAGALLLLVGIVLFGTSLRGFYLLGHGTLAPWDPPQRLVVAGPYRWVRNPMIAGVIFLLFGTALVMRSVPHAVWAAGVLVVNALYIPAWEEPRLARRFGVEYDRYRRRVPRFLPRLYPWRGAANEHEAQDT